MNDKMNKKNSYYDKFWTEVEKKEKTEIRFHVNGEEYYAQQAQELIKLCEDESYMQGYTLDSDGKIIEVELNRITKN